MPSQPQPVSPAKAVSAARPPPLPTASSPASPGASSVAARLLAAGFKAPPPVPKTPPQGLEASRPRGPPVKAPPPVATRASQASDGEVPPTAAAPLPQLPRGVPEAPPPPKLGLSGKTRSNLGYDPLHVTPAPAPQELRRMRSEPPPAMSAEGGGQRFTDRLLQLLTSSTTTAASSSTAAPTAAPSAAPQAAAVEASAVPPPSNTRAPARPAVSIAFGEDPPPRDSASARQGSCAVCYEEDGTMLQLCWEESCAERFCPSCIQRFSEEAVNRALYAVPWIHCPAPGCGGRVSTAAWSIHAKEAYDSYAKNAEALLTFRCSTCHDVGTLSIGSEAGSSSASDVEAHLTSSAAAELREAWPDYAYANIAPEDILDIIESGTSSSNSGAVDEAMTEVLKCIKDLERRTCLQLAWLRRKPFIHTPCCDSEFCFKCKVGVHHEDVTCEERMREELEIHCQFCPTCEVPTVRTEGCDHIICVCGTDWTWMEQVEAGYALGPTAFLRELLEKGTLDPCWVNEEMEDMTLLMHAVQEGRGANARLLIEAHADLHARDSHQYSALLHALGAGNGHYRPEVVDLLLEKSAQLSRDDAFLWVKSQGGTCGETCFSRVISLSGIGLEDKDSAGRSLLQLALNTGRTSLIHLLLEKKVCVEQDAAFWFMEGPCKDLQLFERVFTLCGVTVNLPNPQATHRTLLTMAVDGHKADLARHLVLKLGARGCFQVLARKAGDFWPDGWVVPPDIFDVLRSQGESVWAAAPSGGDGTRGKVLKLHIDAVNVPHLQRWFYSEDLRKKAEADVKEKANEALQRVLGLWDDDADRFARSHEGAELLTDSVKQSVWAAARRLLAAGASCNCRMSKGPGPPVSPLDVVACTNSVDATVDEFLNLLLEARANVLDRNSAGKTALEVAQSQFQRPPAERLARLKAVTEAAAEERAKRMSKSGDGSLENVGIKLHGDIRCPQCSQRFETVEAQQIHWRFIHDPKRHHEE